jgi:hypothetical protein
MAKRSTSMALPAPRSATERASRHTSGVSTTIGDTTESTGLRAPSKDPAEPTSTTNASDSRPAERNGTFTRTPGTTASASSGGIA